MTLFDFILMIPGLIFVALFGSAIIVGFIFGILCVFHFAGLVIKGSVTSIMAVFKRDGTYYG